MSLLDLVATLTLDTSEYRKNLTGAETDANTFGGALAGGLMSAAKLGIRAIVGIGEAATSLVKTMATSAVSSYASYEQLAGGVQKLYGNMGMSLEEYAASQGKTVDVVKDSWESLEAAQSTVMKNAQNAYLTAGMSANKYMETATSFSAALINSLEGDTQKAADLTDVAMRAMSDNINTFGSSMDSVQYAFQGFAKQNYTMLDNLKLGYGGTKSEMERLIADANEYRASIGQSADLSIDSFADIVQAIQSVQEAQGIAGTTNREAMKTLEGSANATKAAWDNVMIAIGRGEGITEAMDNLTRALFGAAEGEGLVNQIVPRIKIVFESIGNFVSTAAPYITSKLPGLVAEIVPQLIQAGISMASMVMSALPSIVGNIVNNDTTKELLNNAINAVQNVANRIKDELPGAVATLASGLRENLTNVVQDVTSKIRDELPGAVTTLADSLRENLTNIIPIAMETLMEFSGSLRENVGLLVDAGLEMVMAIADGIIANIPVFVETVPTIVSNIAGLINDNMPKIFATGIEILGKLVAGLISAIPVIAANMPKIIKAIANVITAFNWVNLGKNIIKGIVNGVKNLAASIPQAIRNIIQTGGNIVKNFGWASLGRGIIQMLANGVRGLASSIPSALRSIGTRAMSAFRSINWLSLGKNVISGIASGILGGAGRIVSAAKSAASRALESAKNFLGIKSPSRVFRDQVGMQMARGMALGFEKGVNERDYTSPIDDVIDSLGDDDYGYVDAGSVTVNTEDRVLAQILSMLVEYLPTLTQTQIVLSTGEVVGALAPAMNTEIGRLNLRQTRREGIR